MFSSIQKNGHYYTCAKYNGSELHILRVRTGLTILEFDIELISGEWPNDKDILTLCDGDDPKHPCHFGGKVTKNSNKAHAILYID